MTDASGQEKEQWNSLKIGEFGENSLAGLKIGELRDAVIERVLTQVGDLAVVNGNLFTASAGRQLQTILVTSGVRGEGKTLGSIGLGYALGSLANHRVLLVDGSIGKPGLDGLFQLDPAPGLTDYILSDEFSCEAVIHKTSLKNVDVLCSGTQIAHSMDVFTSPHFGEKLSALAKAYRFLIFDTPAFLTCSDVSIAVSKFDGVLLVLACEQTKTEVTQLVLEKIDKVGGRVLGVILNRRKYYIPKFLYKII
ncbi:MAG: CpsD/CapB family tyrosine-protein kinase [Magnetococcus sp. DMHC-6]